MSKLQADFLHMPDQQPVITAGSTLYIHLDVCDSYRNPTPNTQPVLVEIIGGPVLHQLSAEDANEQLQPNSQLSGRAAASSHALVYAAEVQKAGCVMVGALLGGVQLSNGWPKSLLMLPGKPSAAHCLLGSHCEVRQAGCSHSNTACTSTPLCVQSTNRKENKMPFGINEREPHVK